MNYNEKKLDDEQAEEAAGGVGRVKGTPGGNGEGNDDGVFRGPWF